jgi:AcrR family transcriptional regulator
MTDKTSKNSKAPSGAPEPEGRRERRKRELRERIYEVSSLLFASQGYEATTVEQISTAADIVPATFFNHFQNKRAVLLEMTGEVVTHIQTLLDQAMHDDRGIRAQLVGFADHAAHDIEQARAIAREVMLTIVGSGTKPGETAPYLAQVHEPFAAILRSGQLRGDVRTDLDPEFLAEMVLGILNATVTNWLADPDSPIEKRIRQAADFASQAIQPRP